MRSWISIALVLACAGCAGDPPDSDRCRGKLYDPCNEEHDCETQDCRPFAAEGFQVCTVVCSAGTPCPDDASGAAAACDATGLCKPAAANACELPE